MSNQETAREIVKEILDRGLGDSTFRELHDAAYDYLCHFRADMEGSVEKILDRVHPE